MTARDELLAAALDYAGRDWPVVLLHGMVDGACTCGREDCSSPGKHPRTKNGLKDATTDPETIRTWWAKRAYNVGLLTGIAFDVVDCDDPSNLAWFDLCEQLGVGYLEAPMVRTGSGGLHVFVAPTGLGNRAKFAPQLDYRGDGGYVVAPPSVHSSGSTYIWL